MGSTKSTRTSAVSTSRGGVNAYPSTEDLNVHGMLKNHKLAKHLADANFGEIRRQLVYKTTWHGNTLHLVDRFFPSSKLCSCCSTINAKLTLTDRTYVCTRCGMVKDRDVNAAINFNTVGRARPEPTDACGHDGSASDLLSPEATSMAEAGSENIHT